MDGTLFGSLHNVKIIWDIVPHPQQMAVANSEAPKKFINVNYGERQKEKTSRLENDNINLRVLILPICARKMHTITQK